MPTLKGDTVRVLQSYFNSNKARFTGIGCATVGRTVASDTRGPWFESSHQQCFIMKILLLTVEKTKKKKEAGNGPQKQGKNPITDSIESLPDYERTLFAG